MAQLSPAAAEVVLIRHGETAWNRERRLQGQWASDLQPGGPGLNPVGLAQAELLARLARSGRLGRIDAVYSSDLSRALETAGSLADALGLPVQGRPEFRERHFGEVQGLTVPEARATVPEAYARMCEGAPVSGGGESGREVQDRMRCGVARLAEAHPGGRVAVVSHGGAIAALHEGVTGEPCRERILNLALSTVHVDAGRDLWVAGKFGDVAHLEAGGVAVARHGFGGDAQSG